MGITRKLNGADLVEGPLQVRRPLDETPFEIEVTPRIGITPLRRLAAALRDRGQPLREPLSIGCGADALVRAGPPRIAMPVVGCDGADDG